MENFKIIRYKSASEVSWLKDIRLALVDTYFQDVTDYQEQINYEIGNPVCNSIGEKVGTIIDVINGRNNNSEKIFVKVELISLVNFDSLIQLGVPIENIVFGDIPYTEHNIFDNKNQKNLE